MPNYTPEQHTVAETFRQSFDGCRSRPLLLYGLGRNTEAILGLCPEIKIAGVMGPDASGETWHGKPVITTERAAELQADIVIVARNAVVPIIYQRIAVLEARGVHIFRVNGQAAVASSQYENRSLPYWNETVELLKARIDTAKYISFDIFDTLLARRVLHPEDIFDKLEHRLQWAVGFRIARVAAQKRLGVTANIGQLYDAVGAALGWTEKQKREAQETEWQLECDTVYPRADMVSLLRYAETQGKHVWLLTDMYWPEARLRKLLAKIGAETYAPMIVSCEAGCCKEDGGLFREYLRRTGAEPTECLHIGDNRYADVASAEEAGLVAGRIYNGYNLLEESAAQRLLSHEADSPAALGAFVASRFASPFALHQTRGLLPVDGPFELGRDFIGPLIDFWLEWLRRELIGSNIARMLFPARDGYLIYRLYELLREKEQTLPPGVYFKASRRAVTVASIRSEADAFHLADRVFHGTTRAFFAQRFGIDVADETPWENGSERASEMLSRQMQHLLQNAAEERENYLRYLAELELPCGGTCGFFDFAAGGTVQHFYEQLTKSCVKGYYFATMNLPNAFYREGDIAAPFGNITSYGDNPLAEGYLMLESVLTDPDTTLTRIGTDGKPVFRTGKNTTWPVMEQVQNGICDYVQRRIAHAERPADRETALAIWKLLFDGSCAVLDSLREAFRHEDGYDGSGSELCWQKTPNNGQEK